MNEENERRRRQEEERLRKEREQVIKNKFVETKMMNDIDRYNLCNFIGTEKI